MLNLIFGSTSLLTILCIAIRISDFNLIFNFLHWIKYDYITQNTNTVLKLSKYEYSLYPDSLEIMIRAKIS